MTGARRLNLAAALTAVAFVTGCGEDPRGACRDAYDHLRAIGHQGADAELERRFLDACVDAWDEAQVRCLLRAATPDEAVACRPTKTRPG